MLGVAAPGGAGGRHGRGYVNAGSAMPWSGLQVKAMVTA